MSLTKTALQHIYTDKGLRRLLVLALDRTEATIIRWANKNNDLLTRPAALKVIREVTGLQDAELIVT